MAEDRKSRERVQRQNKKITFIDGMLGVGAVAIPAAKLVAQIAPIPGLSIATSLVENIFASVEKLRYNKTQSKRLAESARDVVEAVDKAISRLQPDEIDDTLVENVDKLIQTLQQIDARLNELAEMNFVKRLIQSSQIQEDLAVLDSECQQAAKLFMIRVVVDLKANQVKNEQARKDDMLALMEELRRINQNPDEIAERVGLRGTTLDHESTDGIQILLHKIDNDPTVNPEIRTFAEAASRTIKSRTNYDVPRTLPWFVKSKDIKRLEKIGAGGFSVVYKGYWHTRQSTVAVKYFHERDSINELIDEISIWKSFSHPYLHKFLGAAPLEKPAFVVSPYCKEGNALDYILNRPDANRFQILHDVSRGMEYLHDCEVIHGDLKARNVLITDRGKAVVADFGLAKFQRRPAPAPKRDAPEATSGAESPSSSSKITLVGTLHWLAPECFVDGAITKKTDIWAMGMTAYEIFTNGCIPLIDLADDEIGVRLQEGVVPERIDDPPIPDTAWTMMARCWTFDPDYRPSFKELSPLLGVFPESLIQALQNADDILKDESWGPGSTEYLVSNLMFHFDIGAVKNLPAPPPPPLSTTAEAEVIAALRALDIIAEHSVNEPSVAQTLVETSLLQVVEFILRERVDLSPEILCLSCKLPMFLIQSWPQKVVLDAIVSCDFMRHLVNLLGKSTSPSVNVRILETLVKFVICNSTYDDELRQKRHLLELGIIPKLLEVQSIDGETAATDMSIEFISILGRYPTSLVAETVRPLAMSLADLSFNDDQAVQYNAIQSLRVLLGNHKDDLRSCGLMSRLIAGWKNTPGPLETWMSNSEYFVDSLSTSEDLETFLALLFSFNNTFTSQILSTVQRLATDKSDYFVNDEGYSQQRGDDERRKLLLGFKTQIIASGCLSHLSTLISNVESETNITWNVCTFMSFLGGSPTAFTASDLAIVVPALITGAIGDGGSYKSYALQTILDLTQEEGQLVELRKLGILNQLIPSWYAIRTRDQNWTPWLQSAWELIERVATKDDIGELRKLLSLPDEDDLKHSAVKAFIQIGPSVSPEERQNAIEWQDLISALRLLLSSSVDYLVLSAHSAILVISETSVIPSLIEHLREEDEASRLRSVQAIEVMIRKGSEDEKMTAMNHDILEALQPLLRTSEAQPDESLIEIRAIAIRALASLIDGLSEDSLGIVADAYVDADLHTFLIASIHCDRENFGWLSEPETKCIETLQKMARSGDYAKDALVRSTLLPLIRSIIDGEYASASDVERCCLIIEGLLSDDEEEDDEIPFAIASAGLIKSLVKCIKSESSSADTAAYSLSSIILSTAEDIFPILKEGDAIPALKEYCSVLERANNLFGNQPYTIVEYLQHPEPEVQQFGLFVTSTLLNASVRQKKALMKTAGLQGAIEQCAKSGDSGTKTFASDLMTKSLSSKSSDRAHHRPSTPRIRS